MENITKIRPKATVEFNCGNDGRDSHLDIDYRCPNCDIRIREGVCACKSCGTFFDWNKHAVIKVIHSIDWE